MTRENAKQLLPIIQAYAEGKTVEHYSAVDGRWWAVDDPHFDSPPKSYRIAPEKPAPPLWSRPEHVPLRAWIRPVVGSSYHWLIVGCDLDTIVASRTNQITYPGLVRYEHSTDQGKTWKPCTVAEGAV